MTGGRTILLLFFLLLSAMGAEGQNLVVVSKWNQRLVVQNPQGDTLLSCRVGLGSNIGQKRMEGDRRTPEGIFPIVEIQDASQWRHMTSAMVTDSVGGLMGPGSSALQWKVLQASACTVPAFPNLSAPSARKAVCVCSPATWRRWWGWYTKTT